MTGLLDDVISEMIGSSTFRIVKAALEELQCDHLLSNERDVASVLHSIIWLGRAAHAILDSEVASESTKVSIAKKYLGIINLDKNGKIPPRELRGGIFDEPRFTLETALFLAERGEYDWDDEETMRTILFFASPSRFVRTPVETKASFLSLLIGRLNSDRALLQKFSSVLLYEDELAKESVERIPYAHDPLGLEKLGDDKRTLLQNIMPLLDSDHKRSSFSLVCGISCLNDEDLQNFFLDMSVHFWRQVPNAVFAFHDLADTLSRRGVTPLYLMRKVIERGARHRDVDEQRVKALIRVAESTGDSGAAFVKLVRRLLRWHMETDSRLFLFKFVYGKTRDARILDEASRFESHKIRSWRAQELNMIAGGQHASRRTKLSASSDFPKSG